MKKPKKLINYQYTKTNPDEKIVHKLCTQNITPKDDEQNSLFQGKPIADLPRIASTVTLSSGQIWERFSLGKHLMDSYGDMPKSKLKKLSRTDKYEIKIIMIITMAILKKH